MKGKPANVRESELLAKLWNVEIIPVTWIPLIDDKEWDYQLTTTLMHI